MASRSEATGSSTLSLRDRQRARVVADIHRAAFELIAERGFDDVTTDEIAMAAGISPRTFFRYVATKDDLLLATVRERGALVMAIIESRPATEAPDVALTKSLLKLTQTVDEFDVKAWRRAILNAPDQLAKVGLTPVEDMDGIVELIAARMGVDPELDGRPGLLVHLALAAGNYGFQRWLRHPVSDERPLSQYVAEALEAVRSRRWRPVEAST